MISVLHKKGKPLQEAITPIITVFRQPLAAKQSRLRSLLQICLPPPQACNFKYQHIFGWMSQTYSPFLSIWTTNPRRFKASS